MPLQQERTGKKLIYVVDDEAVIASTLAAIIQSEGFDARYFTQPQLALEAAQARVPDLLLSDVFMPEMTGVELAIEISQLHPQCKVLLLSGQAATVDLLEKAHQRGHRFDLLSKPLHPLTLLKNLKRLLFTDSPIAAE